MVNELNKRLSLALIGPSFAALVILAWSACGQMALGAASATVNRQTFMTVGGPARVKVENHFVISYKLKSTDQSEPQIQIFEQNGAAVVSINPLAAVPQAVESAVWDVSIGSSGLVAVTVDFPSRPSFPPIGALLIYSRNGTLEKALRYTGYQIIGVEVDSQDHIWALNGGANVSGDPGTFPVLVEYDQGGNILRTAFTFSEFPQDAVFVKEGPREGGAFSFGLTTDKVWFWLPQSRMFGVVNIDGTHPTVVYTGLPPSPELIPPSPVKAFAQVVGAAYVPPDRLLAKVIFVEGSPRFVSLYEFDLSAMKWIHLSPPRSVDFAWRWFVGVDDGLMVLGSPVSKHRNNPAPKEIELDWIPLQLAIAQAAQ